MLRKAATAGAFGMALALAQAPANADDNLYGATGSSKTPSSLYTIDPATGAATQVGEIGFNHVVSIDFHPITGVLYGISNSGPDRSLITIDPATGAGTLVVNRRRTLTPDRRAILTPLGMRGGGRPGSP
jgi:hypothetical protein